MEKGERKRSDSTSSGWSGGMANLGEGLRADGLPAGRAERPEDFPP